LFQEFTIFGLSSRKASDNRWIEELSPYITQVNVYNSILCMSPLYNTPDSDPQLVIRAVGREDWS